MMQEEYERVIQPLMEEITAASAILTTTEDRCLAELERLRRRDGGEYPHAANAAFQRVYKDMFFTPEGRVDWERYADMRPGLIDYMCAQGCSREVAIRGFVLPGIMSDVRNLTLGLIMRHYSGSLRVLVEG